MVVHIAGIGQILRLRTFMIFLNWILNFTQISPVFPLVSFPCYEIEPKIVYMFYLSYLLSLLWSIRVLKYFFIFITLRVLRSSGQILFRLYEFGVFSCSSHAYIEITYQGVRVLTMCLVTGHVNLVHLR